MASLEWTILADHGPQILPHLSRLADVVVAEVDPSGIVRSLNAPGEALWGWTKGRRVPTELLRMLLRMPEEGAHLLPRRIGRVSALALRRKEAAGWWLIGFVTKNETNSERPSDFQSLIETMPFLVMRMDADGTILTANPAAEQLTGRPVEALIGHAYWLEAVHPEDRWKLNAALRTTRTDGQASATVRFARLDRTVRLAELHFAATAEGDQIEAIAFDVTERSEIEEALFQSEALYRTFLEQSPIGMFHLDAEGTITFENHPFRQIVGEGVEDAWIGRTVDDIPGLAPQVYQGVKALLDMGHAFHGVKTTYRSSSSPTVQHLMLHGSPIRHPEGSIVGGVVMVEDVTEQRRRDEELSLRNQYAKAEAGLREVALADPEVDTFLNQAAALMGQATRADRVRVLVHAEVDEACMTRATWQHRGEAPEPLVASLDELPLLRRLEKQRRCQHVHPASQARGVAALRALVPTPESLWEPFYVGGRLGGFVLFERDASEAPTWEATELPLIEQLTRVFEALWAWIQVGTRHRQTVATIDDCLFNFAFAGRDHRRYLFVTHQIETLTGYAPEAVQERGPKALAWTDTLVHPEDRERVRDHDARLREGQESRIVYRIQHRDGALRWLREHGTPHREASGRITVSGILTDLTEQKAAEQVLLKAKQEAEYSNQLKTAFIATMSHEIRSPLGTVKGFADLLLQELGELEDDLDRPLPAQIHEFASIIQDRSRELLDLVGDLFDLSNVETGAVSLRRASVPLNDLAEGALDQHRDRGSSKGLILRTQLDAAGPVVYGDARRIEQVLDNLISNAIKFTERGAVTVTTRAAGDEAVIEVSDTGVGIAPEYLEKLFTPFSQEENWRNRRFEGTGLGLTLVKRLIDLMGGRIEVTSTKGVGTTFRVFFPTPAAARDRHRPTGRHRRESS